MVHLKGLLGKYYQDYKDKGFVEEDYIGSDTEKTFMPFLSFQ